MPLRGFARQMAFGQRGYQSPNPMYVLEGLNEDDNTLAMRPAQLRKANNVARKDSMTGTRPGLSYPGGDYAARLVAEEPVVGIHQFSIDRDTSTYRLVTVSDGNAYIDDAAGNVLDKATNSVTITGGANNLWTFDDFQIMNIMAQFM